VLPKNRIHAETSCVSADQTHVNSCHWKTCILLFVVYCNPHTVTWTRTCVNAAEGRWTTVTNCMYCIGVISYLSEAGELLPQFTAEGTVKKLALYSDKSSVATLTDKMILSLHVVLHNGTLQETLKVTCFPLVNHQTLPFCWPTIEKFLLYLFFYSS